MDSVLFELGLGELSDTFNSNAVSPRDVMHFNEEDFLQMNVTRLGDRVRLREACRNFLKAEAGDTSSIVDRIKLFQEKRRGKKSQSNVRHMKTSRNIHIGWKHHGKKGFILVSEGKGGAKFHLDVDKDTSLIALKDLICSKYFPDGKNEISGLKLADLESYIATFTGKALPSTLNCGEEFTLGGFLKEYQSSPIRLYLHTKIKVEESQSDCEDFEETSTPTISFRRRRLTLSDTFIFVEMAGGSVVDNMILFIRMCLDPDLAKRKSHGTRNKDRVTPGPSRPTLDDVTPGPSRPTLDDVTPGPSRPTLDDVTPGPSRPTLNDVTPGPSRSAIDHITPGPSRSAIDHVTPGPSRSAIDHATPGPSRSAIDHVTPGPLCSSQEMSVWQNVAYEIEISESEDEEFEKAMEESLAEYRDACRQAVKKNLPEILDEFCERHITEDKTKILVYKRRVLDSAFKAFVRPSFKPNCKLNVKFCEGEMGEDYGGPTREFLRLALDELSKSNMFMGSDTEKIFQHNIERLEQGHFNLAGRLVALSFIHDGSGPHFLNQSLFDLMTDLSTDLAGFNVETLPSDEREILQTLKAMSTDDDRDRFLHQYGNWLIEQGFSNPYRFALDEKGQLYKTIVKQLIFFRESSEISDFQKGMNEICGFWDIVKENAATFKDSFCSSPIPLSKESFLALCKTMFSEPGSNKRRAEEDTQYAWELFLLDIEENCVDVSFSDLLVFITGADKPPCRGFQRKISISFYEMEEGVKRIPFSSTCALELSLPRNVQDPKIFQDLMMTALKESYGFGKV